MRALSAIKVCEGDLAGTWPTRRQALLPTIAAAGTAMATLAVPVAWARCTDIESCREVGDQKVAAADAANPTVKLGDGVRYKVLKAGSGPAAVGDGSVVDLAYSISQSSGAYMYSSGFGYEKTASGDRDVLETYRAKVGSRDVPVGIERALVGMKKGERRRVELPPAVGLATSEWRPEPTTRRGKSTITGYRRILDGNGSSQPPFPAETVWDVEVVRIR